MSEDAHVTDNHSRYDRVLKADDHLNVGLSAEKTPGGGSTYAELRYRPGQKDTPQADKNQTTQPRTIMIPFRTKRNGPGATVESLLLAASGRLQQWQEGPDPCDENVVALASIRTAILALIGRNDRLTADQGKGS